MEFLKKHYEKIILSLALIGLAVVAVRLPIAMSDAKAELENTTGPAPKTKPPPPFDLSPEEKAMNQLTNPPHCMMSGENNTFNPVIWKLKPDGTLMRITQEGPAALKISKITPLYTEIAFDGAPEGGTGYYFLEKKSSEKRPREYVKINQKSKDGSFVVKGVKGPPENPSEVELELPELHTNAWVSKTQPYMRVDSYSADFHYPGSTEQMVHKKTNDVLKLDGDSYKIIEINTNGVRVVSKSAKQYQIEYNQAPTP
jgi:hypothetical protein